RVEDGPRGIFVDDDGRGTGAGARVDVVVITDVGARSASAGCDVAGAVERIDGGPEGVADEHAEIGLGDRRAPRRRPRVLRERRDEGARSTGAAVVLDLFFDPGEVLDTPDGASQVDLVRERVLLSE